MIIYKGNRFSSPHFRTPILQLENKQIIKSGKITTPFYSPRIRANSFFEHLVVKGARAVRYRGLWDNGIAYPLTAEVGDYHFLNIMNPRVYYFEPVNLPDYFTMDKFHFINFHSEVLGEDIPVFPMHARFSTWYDHHVTVQNWQLSPEERIDISLVEKWLPDLHSATIERERQMLDMYYNARLLWMGALVLPLWCDTEDYKDIVVETTKSILQEVVAA